MAVTSPTICVKGHGCDQTNLRKKSRAEVLNLPMCDERNSAICESASQSIATMSWGLQVSSLLFDQKVEMMAIRSS